MVVTLQFITVDSQRNNKGVILLLIVCFHLYLQHVIDYSLLPLIYNLIMKDKLCCWLYLHMFYFQHVVLIVVDKD